MDKVIDLIKFINENQAILIQFITGIISFASLIARFTPTKVDDEVIQKIIDVINFFALNKPQK